MSRRENGSWIFEIFIQNNSQTGRESKQIGDAAEAIGAEEISEVYLQAVRGCGWRIVISPMLPQDFPSLLRFCDGQSPSRGERSEL